MRPTPRRRRIEGDIVFDTSVIVEILLATPHGRRLVEDIVEGLARPYTSSLNLAEAYYVTCRLLGREEAETRIRLLLRSGYFNVVEAGRIWRTAALCKCRFPISLADCHTLALAKSYALPPLFYRVEREFEDILGEIEEWVGARLLFLS